MTPLLFDIGINLMHKSFQPDREQVLKRALAAGVTRLIITGSSVRSSEEAAAFAREYPGTLYATAGVHPHDSRHCTPDTLAALRQLASQPPVVAIGECGLDYNRDFSPRPVQDHWFEAQVQLAGELNMPLFLHERDAHQRLVAILSNHRIGKAVIHCFTGSEAELDTYLSMGLYIGITGWICDERRGTHLQSLVQRIPADRLMLETDAPFLTPRDMRPKPRDGRNEPAFLPYVLNAVARATGKSPDEVAAATTDTACSFFGIER